MVVESKYSLHEPPLKCRSDGIGRQHSLRNCGLKWRGDSTSPSGTKLPHMMELVDITDSKSVVEKRADSNSAMGTYPLWVFIIILLSDCRLVYLLFTRR